MKLVLATHNAHKVEELRRILGPLLDGLEVLPYDGPEPVEDGSTFEANALIKARAAAAHTGLPAIADDSGLAVEALGGAPGIHSARYAGTRVDGEHEFTVRAEWQGEIAHEPAGAGGFGYDPVFRPAGLSVSAAELSPDEKNAISHRGQAFGRLMPLVRTRLLG